MKKFLHLLVVVLLILACAPEVIGENNTQDKDKIENNDDSQNQEEEQPEGEGGEEEGEEGEDVEGGDGEGGEGEGGEGEEGGEGGEGGEGEEGSEGGEGEEEGGEGDTEQDPVTPPVQKEVIKILAIGNSFSEDAVEQELYGLFNAVGQKVIIGNMYIGGCSLQKHWEQASADAASYSYRKIVNGVKTTTANTKLSTALKDEQWDYISFQQGAGNHGVYDTFEPELTKMINYCREKAANKDFKVIYHVPWVAQANYTGSKFGIYDYNQAKMYSMIVSATQKIASEHSDFALVMNVMDAIENGKSSYLGDTFYRDGWHLNKTYGRYTASCLWFEKIMGQSVVGNSYYPDTISAAVAEVCQHAAHEACVNPYKITNLSHFVDPDGTSSATKVLARWYFHPEKTFDDGCAKTWCNQTKAGVYTYSNKAGERGYFKANGAGSGRLSYVQIDKTKWNNNSNTNGAGLCILNASNGGQPVVCGAMKGDYWLFETTGNYELEEGSKVHVNFAYHPSSYGAKYWLIEYSDGDSWKPVYTKKSTTISKSGETITYNFALTASTKTQVDFTVTLDERTTDFKVRITCCSAYQVNDKWFEYPNHKSAQRIAGTPEDNNLPIIEEIL